MGKPQVIAMLSKISKVTDLRHSKMVFPLRQVQWTIFLDSRAEWFGLPPHYFDKILRAGISLAFDFGSDRDSLDEGDCPLRVGKLKAPDCIGG